MALMDGRTDENTYIWSVYFKWAIKHISKKFWMPISRNFSTWDMAPIVPFLVLIGHLALADGGF